MTSIALDVKQRRNSPRRNAWRRACRLLLLLGMLAPLAPALGQTQSAQPKPFLMSADVTPDFAYYKWALLIYTEAFRRLGIPLEMTSHNLARRSALVAEGVIDGEVARIHAYADAHPELIRVEEVVMEFTFSIFTARPDLHARQLTELPSDALAEYRRGILLCENALKKSIPAERISTVATTEQGLRKVMAGRTDAYCDIDVYIRHELNSGELKGVTGVRKLFDVATLPTYPYLYKKHADLAPRLAAVLKRMRAEGLIDAYWKQVERESGWAK